MGSVLEHLWIIRLLADFGLVVLIWMVQLIVYPGFTFYSEELLLKWHKTYTPRITIIVAPLMFAQMGMALYQCIFDFSIVHLVYLILVISTWISTFIYFVPLHHNIEANRDLKSSANRLTKGNWIRTIQWTFIFIYGVICLSS
jgi:hypothetical protein